MQFPAGVFLIHHREKAIFCMIPAITSRLRKSTVFLVPSSHPNADEKEDQIDYLLQERGIDPAEITYVILSHLHPDHLGGAALFQMLISFVTREVYEVYQNRNLKI